MLLSRVRSSADRTSLRSTCVRKSENVGAGVFGVLGAIAVTSISNPNVSSAIVRPDLREPSGMLQRTIVCCRGVGSVIGPSCLPVGISTMRSRLHVSFALAPRAGGRPGF